MSHRVWFPFHQGRFQGVIKRTDSFCRVPFPFHQGRFQGRCIVSAFARFSVFPFHQGRFQGKLDACVLWRCAGVSIPPRKVSRSIALPRSTSSSICFHSTKEGFKARTSIAATASSRFPFHQGRFQGMRLLSLSKVISGFHSTKEGFKD